MAISFQEKKIEKIVERAVARAMRKAFLDRELDNALEEVRQGKTYGPFKSARTLVRSLHQEAKKLKTTS